jgi:hypothetical protein
MATSGSTDWTLTARQVINFALKKCGVLPAGGTAAPEDADDAKEELNLILKGMAKDGPFLFNAKLDGSESLVQDQAAYPLTTDNPLRLFEVRYSDANGREIPMTPLTRTQYWELPQKDVKGVPTQYWFDSDSQDQNLYVYPTPGSVTTETIEWTGERKIEDIDSLDDNIDVPEEWLDTIGYRLARRIMISYGVKGERAADIRAMDAELWQAAQDYDREPMITFAPESRYYRSY